MINKTKVARISRLFKWLHTNHFSLGDWKHLALHKVHFPPGKRISFGGQNQSKSQDKVPFPGYNATIHTYML